MIKSWADEYDSDMDEYFNDNNTQTVTKKVDIEQSLKFSDKICERKCSIDYNKFTIVDNSRYSSLMPWYVSQVNTFLSNIYTSKTFQHKKVKKIIDVGANIGVDSINFLLNFPNTQLICFEIESNTYNILCKNLLEYTSVTKLKTKEQLTNTNSNIQAYNKDFLSCFEYIYNADIVFIDAPWGGSIYKDKKNVSIYLQPEDDYYNIHNYDSSKNIIIITKRILEKKYKVRSVLLKVPYNYEFDNFENELKYFNNNISIKYKKIYKGNTNYVAFVLICVFNHYD
jgi:hypothetical protein